MRMCDRVSSTWTDQGGLTRVGWASPYEEDEEEEELRVLKGNITHTPEECTNSLDGKMLIRVSF